MLTRCRHCQSIIPEATLRCPYCAGVTRRGWALFWAAAGVVVAVGWVVLR